MMLLAGESLSVFPLLLLCVQPITKLRIALLPTFPLAVLPLYWRDLLSILDAIWRLSAVQLVLECG